MSPVEKKALELCRLWWKPLSRAHWNWDWSYHHDRWVRVAGTFMRLEAKNRALHISNATARLVKAVLAKQKSKAKHRPYARRSAKPAH